MNLLEVDINKRYTITTMCEITPLVERGVVPGEVITVTKRQGGLVMFDVEGSGQYVVRNEEAKCIKV